MKPIYVSCENEKFFLLINAEAAHFKCLSVNYANFSSNPKCRALPAPIKNIKSNKTYDQMNEWNK